MDFYQAALSCEWRKTQINPSSNKTNSISSVLKIHTLLDTLNTCSHTHKHTHTHNQRKSVLLASCPLCAWQQSLNHTIPKSLTRCSSYMGSTSFSTGFFSFVQLELCEKATKSFFFFFFLPRLFKPWTLWEESCEREVKQTTSSNKPDLFEVWVAIFHLCQCKILSLTTAQWHAVSDVSIPGVHLKVCALPLLRGMCY